MPSSVVRAERLPVLIPREGVTKPCLTGMTPPPQPITLPFPTHVYHLNKVGWVGGK